MPPQARGSSRVLVPALKIPVSETAATWWSQQKGQIFGFRASLPHGCGDREFLSRYRRHLASSIVSQIVPKLQAAAVAAELKVGPMQIQGLPLFGDRSGSSLQFDLAVPEPLVPLLLSLLDDNGSLEVPAANGVPALRWTAWDKRVNAPVKGGSRWLRVSGLLAGMSHEPGLVKAELAPCFPGVEIEAVEVYLEMGYGTPLERGDCALIKMPAAAKMPSDNVVFSVQWGPRRVLYFAPEDYDAYCARQARGPQLGRMPQPPPLRPQVPLLPRSFAPSRMPVPAAIMTGTRPILDPAGPGAGRSPERGWGR